MRMENIITLTVSSTHFFLIDCKGGKLLIDAGWTLQQFISQMKAYKVPFSDIRYVMFTHHHPDHAELVQSVRNLSGAKLIIHEKQIPYLENLRTYAEKKGKGVYEPIRVEKDALISPTRDALLSIGIHGEIVKTPGHSDDSISLVLDSGAAFIGDLQPPGYAEPESDAVMRASWQNLIDLGARMFYHSHADPIPVERIQALLRE